MLSTVLPKCERVLSKSDVLKLAKRLSPRRKLARLVPSNISFLKNADIRAMCSISQFGLSSSIRYGAHERPQCGIFLEKGRTMLAKGCKRCLGPVILARQYSRETRLAQLAPSVEHQTQVVARGALVQFYFRQEGWRAHT